MLEALRADAAHAGLLLDFDGTLAELVARPELAQPAPGAREALAALVSSYAVVAVITGRRAEEVAALLGVDGLRYEGLYGMQDAAPELALALLPRVEAAAAAEPAAWVEDKGASLAVHYRQAEDPQVARSRLIAALAPVAASAGLELVEGKRVVELVPPGRPRKGETVERLAGELALGAVLYAGDDLADADAFDAMDRLHARGVATVKVAVRGDETPSELLDAADLVVEGPAGLVDLLRGLA
ncbi:MAG TPA: trehalose-phosphatase [Actinomycetota bacterium]